MPEIVSTERQVPDSERSRWIALVVLCAGALMIILDMTIVNVALPSMQHDLHFSQSSLAWVVNAYLITFGGLLLLAGRLGDLLGRRNMFLVGLAVFVAASALCGAAESQTVLIAARFIQGVGGALASAVILGMIVTMFPQPADQAKAIGVFSFVAAAGASIGLLLGGVITQAINWHWIFFVNLPIGVLTAVLAVRLVGRDVGIGLRGGADVLGAVLVTAALMLGVYTIVKTQDYGWGSAHTLGLGAVAIALLVGFVAWEARAKNPLMPLRIFRSRNVSGANLVQMLFIAGMFGMFFLGSLFMERVLGYSALQIGLAFLPVAVLIAAFSLGVAARLIVRVGAKATLLPGLAFGAAGLALFARVPVGANYLTDLLPPMILVGIGAGLSFPALMTLAMSSAHPTDAGLASGLVNTTQQVGGALGLAVLATVSASHTTALEHAGRDAAAALTGGYHLAWVIGTGLLIVALATAIAVLRPVPVAVAEQVVEPVDDELPEFAQAA
ncbi:MAG TPA: DHA2 family efflux MFS transporter permease subunit [Solirubrobacteraceae bacterium]|jgi:EmrB/QacA subfamily drug resistance transporter